MGQHDASRHRSEIRDDDCAWSVSEPEWPMLIVDEGDWPLVLLRWEAPIAAIDIDLFHARFQSWLQRDRGFAVLSVQPQPQHGEDQRLFADHWLRPLRAFARRRCCGIASVVPEAMAQPESVQVYALQLEQRIGCPVRACFDSDDALRWLRERLQIGGGVG
jgi:hypothetical protein